MFRHVKVTRELTLDYHIGEQAAARGRLNGGVSEPEYINEINVDVYEDEVWSDDVDRFVPSGKTRIRLYGPPRAYRSVAT